MTGEKRDAETLTFVRAGSVQHDITYFRISPLHVIPNLFRNLKGGDAENPELVSGSA